MKKLIRISAALMCLTFLTAPVFAAPPFVVVGEMDSAVDVTNVQTAVDNHKKVLLRGSFDFGYPSDPTAWPPSPNVVITTDVEISGETDEDGAPLTTIYGGYWTFYAPLPTPADPAEWPAFFKNGPSVPGPKISIKNINFIGAIWMPIYISHTSGVKIKNNKITNVFPVGPLNIFGPNPEYWGHGIVIMTMWDDPRLGLASVVPNAITGQIVVKKNEIDLEVYAPYDPLYTMGQGVFVIWSWGADLKIKDNIVRNVTRNSIEVLNCYKDENGKGSIAIKENDIITAEVGIRVPSNSTPNGIVVGWFNDPLADPEKTPETAIKGNYVEGKGETSMGVVVLSPGAIIKDNEIVVNDGFYVDSGASGIIIAGEKAVVCKNEITINPIPDITGEAGSGILIASDKALVIMNKIRFNGESPANGIFQVASKGLIALNKIKGSGNAAIFLYSGIGTGGLYYAAENNRILWNKFREFEAGLADVVFMGMSPGTGASYNTLIGWGGTVFDWGLNNEIIGDWEILP